LNVSPQKLVFAVSAVTEENQTEPLGNCRVHSETTLQIIRAPASNDKPLKQELRVYLHVVAFNPDRRLKQE